MGERCREDAGKGTESFLDLLENRTRSRLVVAAAHRIDVEEQRVPPIEAGVHALQIPYGADEQARDDDKKDRQGDLHDQGHWSVYRLAAARSFRSSSAVRRGP
jgi:hypothetical protein